MEGYVLSLIDHAHPATAHLLDDAVVRDSLADHLAEILGLGVGQVNEGQKVSGVPARWLMKNLDFANYGF